MRIHYITATVTPTEKSLSVVPMIGKRKKKRKEKRIYIYMIVLSRNNFNAGLTMPAPLWDGWQSRIMVFAVLQRIKEGILVEINQREWNMGFIVVQRN